MPKIVKITKEDIEKIETMAGMGMRIDDIALVLNCTARTIQNHIKKNDELKDALKRGRAKANFNVAQKAYEMAMSGNIPAMTIFWLKTRANWQEKMHIELSGDSDNPIAVKSEDINSRIEKFKKGKE